MIHGDNFNMNHKFLDAYIAFLAQQATFDAVLL